MTNHTRITPMSRRRKLALSAGIAVGSLGVIGGVGGGQASAIVDGSDTTATENPWQVALTSPDGEQFCGGSIVSDRVILTAAHCVEGSPESDISIRAGTTDLTSSGGQTRGVTAIVEHPKYATGVGDIAMLVLDRPLDMGGDVQAISLATSADIDAAETARVTGWGVVSENSDRTPSTLQTTDVPLVSDADCGLIEEGNADELCAGGTGTDSCYGDSGGPLTVSTENGRVLAGVVSWGEECGGESAGVYAEVPTFADWVAERIAEPDAPAGDRVESPDGFEDGDFEDGDYIEIEDEFFDQFTDDELDAMTDDEFFDAYDEWLDGASTDGAWIDDTDQSSETDSPVTSGDLPSNAEIDAMTDREFDDFINGLSDADFDAFLDQYDVEFTDADVSEGDGPSFDDTFFDTESGDLNDDDIVQWNELDPDMDTYEFDLNNDDIVQWSELVG